MINYVSLSGAPGNRRLLNAQERAELLITLDQRKGDGTASTYRTTDRHGVPFGLVAVHDTHGRVTGVYEVSVRGLHRATTDA